MFYMIKESKRYRSTLEIKHVISTIYTHDKFNFLNVELQKLYWNTYVITIYFSQVRLTQITHHLRYNPALLEEVPLGHANWSPLQGWKITSHNVYMVYTGCLWTVCV